MHSPATAATDEKAGFSGIDLFDAAGLVWWI
jgi:hypothetical protein